MKKYIIICIMVFSLVGLVSCKERKDDIEIAFISDSGGIDDASYNEVCWNGVKKYAIDNNKTYACFRPFINRKEAKINAIEKAIKKGAKVVVCPTKEFVDIVNDLYTIYPNVDFLLFDGEIINANNVYCINFKEEEAGFLAGYALVMEGYRNLGFIGNEDIKNTKLYGWGYIQGANKAAQDLKLHANSIKIKYNYASMISKLDVRMNAWYTDGVEVIFSCGDKVYEDVIPAAEAANKKLVGYDVDQSNLSDAIITSSMKDYSNMVIKALKNYYDNGMKWNVNNSLFGVKDDVIGLKMGNFKTFIIQNYIDLLSDFENDKIKVDNNIETLFNSNEFLNYRALSYVVVDFNA